MNSQLFINFPQPGEWNHYVLNALWTDSEGFSGRTKYYPADLSDEQREVLSACIGSVVGLNAPWQATHASARLETISPEPLQEGEEGTLFEPYEVLRMEVHARRADGACRMFTDADFSILSSEDAALIELFKNLTQH